MKKLLIFILVFLICPLAFGTPQTSLNSFEIPIDAVPPGTDNSTNSKHSNGLSDGAVTAITLGSVFGGLSAIGGLGWYLTKHNSGLACGCACGVKTPLKPIFLKDFCTDFSKNKALEKAFALIDKSENKKYLFITDMKIKEKSYNTVIFEIPQNMPNFKIIQVAEGQLNSKLIVSNTEIPVKTNLNNKVIIKQGKIPETKEQNAALVIENYKTEQIYAIIIEFSPS